MSIIFGLLMLLIGTKLITNICHTALSRHGHVPQFSRTNVFKFQEFPTTLLFSRNLLSLDWSSFDDICCALIKNQGKAQNVLCYGTEQLVGRQPRNRIRAQADTKRRESINRVCKNTPSEMAQLSSSSADEIILVGGF